MGTLWNESYDDGNRYAQSSTCITHIPVKEALNDIRNIPGYTVATDRKAFFPFHYQIWFIWSQQIFVLFAQLLSSRVVYCLVVYVLSLVQYTEIAVF